MVDSKISGLTETTSINDADMFPIVKASDTTKTYRISGLNLLVETGGLGGWVPIRSACAYINANSFSIAGNYTGRVCVGDKIWLSNGGATKYFYISAVSWSDPNTVLVITGGSAYSLANSAITYPFYSHSNPVGFPDWFNLTAPAWTTTGTAFTNQPTTNIAKFRIAGRKMDIKVKVTCHATSGGTGVFIATFSANQLATILAPGVGAARGFSSQANGNCWMSTTAPLVLNMAKYDNTALATNNEVFFASIGVEI